MLHDMDSLDIDGKEYISARRAAKEHGYVADYIGQLIRAGKLEGKKVGRAWYVSKESLELHFHATEGEQVEAAPKKYEGEAVGKEIPDVETHSNVEIAESAATRTPEATKLEVSTEEIKNESPAQPGAGVEESYPLLRYMQDDEPEFPELTQGGVKDPAGDTPVHIRISNGSGSEETQVNTDLIEKELDGPELLKASRMPAERVMPRSAAQEGGVYLSTSPGLVGLLTGKVSLMAALVFAVLSIGVGAASILASKEISYSDISLSASLRSVNLDLPR